MGDLRTERGVRALYRAYGDELFGFALMRLRDRQAAEELVQDVFERAWRAGGDYDPDRGSVRTWLYGIARNRIIDFERRRGSRPAPPPMDYEGIHEAAYEPVEDALTRWQIERALSSLSREQLAVVRLARIDGYTVREVADHLGVSEGTVKTRMHYAMQHLRLALEEAEVLQ